MNLHSPVTKTNPGKTRCSLLTMSHTSLGSFVKGKGCLADVALVRESCWLNWPDQHSISLTVLLLSSQRALPRP